MPRRQKKSDTEELRERAGAVTSALKEVMSKLNPDSDFTPEEPTEEEVKVGRSYVRAAVIERVFGSTEAVTQYGVAVTAPKTTNFPEDAVVATDTMLEDQLCDLGLILTMYCKARDELLAEEVLDLERLQDVHFGIQSERFYRDQILSMISAHRIPGSHPAVQEALQERADKLNVPAGPPDPSAAVEAYEGDYGREEHQVDKEV